MKILSKKKSYSISWKSAFVIAISLHIAGYVGIKQYSSYKVNKARELKEARNALYNKPNVTEWPQDKLSPQVITKPEPKKVASSKVIPEQPKKKKDIFNFDIKIPIPQITFNSPKPTKVANNTQPKPVQPQPKTTYTKQTINPVKREIPQQTVIRNKPFTNPEDILVRRAVAVKISGNVRETIEETRRIISSHIVL